MERLNIFLSWSDSRSRLVAEALRDWLPMVMQAANPWMSSRDMEKGSRWPQEIAEHLDQIRFGIICLTPENQRQPWINFEAGALSKSTHLRPHVCTYLFGLNRAEVEWPLAQFQSAIADRKDTLQLVETINLAFGTDGIPSAALARQFERWWPDLEEALAQIKQPKSTVPARADRDILEEILEVVRDQARLLHESSVSPTERHAEALPQAPHAHTFRQRIQGESPVMQPGAAKMYSIPFLELLDRPPVIHVRPLSPDCSPDHLIVSVDYAGVRVTHTEPCDHSWSFEYSAE